MIENIEFTNNYSDLSTDQASWFEFNCDCWQRLRSAGANSCQAPSFVHNAAPKRAEV
jgi:hypothetical protein